MIYAYMRISTGSDTQKHDRQEKAIRDYAKANGFTVDQWYKDIGSGKAKAESRTEYARMKAQLKPKDILIVSDLDRLGRDASSTIMELKDLQSRDLRLIALDVPYMNEWQKMNDDSLSKMIIDIVVTLKAHIAQQEREKIVARINQGLAAAREKGVILGRPKAELPKDFVPQYEKYLKGEYGKLSMSGFARMLGIGRSTLYKYITIFDLTFSAEN